MAYEDSHTLSSRPNGSFVSTTSTSPYVHIGRKWFECSKDQKPLSHAKWSSYYRVMLYVITEWWSLYDRVMLYVITAGLYGVSPLGTITLIMHWWLLGRATMARDPQLPHSNWRGYCYLIRHRHSSWTANWRSSCH